MIKEIAALTTILALSGCAVVSSPVGNGTLFTSTKGPITATDSVASSKTGEACAQSILGLIVNGDASIVTAKKAGNISKVATVDHSSLAFLGLYSQFCNTHQNDCFHLHTLKWVFALLNARHDADV